MYPLISLADASASLNFLDFSSFVHMEANMAPRLLACWAQLYMKGPYLSHPKWFGLQGVVSQ